MSETSDPLGVTCAESSSPTHRRPGLQRAAAALAGQAASPGFLLALKAHSAYCLAFSTALLNANTPNTVKTLKFDLQTKCLVFKILKSFDR